MGKIRIAEFERLMAEVAAGSEEAIWQLAETYTPYIVRAVRASLPPQLRSKLGSQDLAQTLWASILLGRTDLTRLKSPEELIAFLSRATKNKVIDATRRYLKTQKYDVSREQSLAELTTSNRHPIQGRANADNLYTHDPTPSQLASIRECWNRILLNASERDRTILRLRLQGFTFDVIAVKLQINQGTARRAIQRLIDQLAE